MKLFYTESEIAKEEEVLFDSLDFIDFLLSLDLYQEEGLEFFAKENTLVEYLYLGCETLSNLPKLAKYGKIKTFSQNINISYYKTFLEVLIGYLDGIAPYSGKCTVIESIVSAKYNATKHKGVPSKKNDSLKSSKVPAGLSLWAKTQKKNLKCVKCINPIFATNEVNFSVTIEGILRYDEKLVCTKGDLRLLEFLEILSLANGHTSIRELVEDEGVPLETKNKIISLGFNLSLYQTLSIERKPLDFVISTPFDGDEETFRVNLKLPSWSLNSVKFLNE